MKHILYKTVIVVVLLSLSYFPVLSCKNKIENQKSVVRINIETDENTDATCNNIEIKVGSKWRNIKKRVLSCVKSKKGYKIDCLMLKEDFDMQEIESNFVFEEDASIYITSKKQKNNKNRQEKDNKDTENGEESEDDEEKEEDEDNDEGDVLARKSQKICIKLKGDRHITIEKVQEVIKKGDRWKDVKEKVMSHFKFEEGYCLNKCKRDSSKGKILADGYVFKKDATVYATSKQEKKKSTIKINLRGDENVILKYVDILDVPKGVKWKKIKESEYIQSARAKDGFHLSDWCIQKGARAKKLEDEDRFSKEETIFVLAISNSSEDSSPNEPHLPNEPSEVDEADDSSADAPLPRVMRGDDETMIDVQGNMQGIRAPLADYPLPNFPVNLNLAEELWQGVFQGDELTPIASFKMSKYELTYRIWEETRKWAVHHGYNFLNDGWQGSKNDKEMSEMQPVTHISWCDAIVWCNAHTEKLTGDVSSCVYLDEQSGLTLKDAKSVASDDVVKDGKVNVKFEMGRKGFRLPTEAEWEYAARKTVFHMNADSTQEGERLTKLDGASGAKTKIASGKTKSENSLLMKKELEKTTVCQWYFWQDEYRRFVPDVLCTKIVGTKRANYLGFHDMSGNVCELSSALTDESIFGKEKGEGVFCVMRGGAWDDFSYDCTVGRRKCVNIHEAFDNLGIRLCCTK